SCMRIALLSLLIVAAAAPARADVIGPMPTDCRDGTRGDACMGPVSGCVPATCTSDADCAGGKSCQPASFCVQRQACGGSLPRPPPGTGLDVVIGTCDASDAGTPCGSGATCQTTHVCVSTGLGCATASDGAPSGAAAALLVALVACATLWRGRRVRR